MTFRLNLSCDNAAFEEDNHEIARILREVADKVETLDSHCYQTVFDVNGNDVGRFRLKEERLT